MIASDLTIRDSAAGNGALCRRILGLLPQWFGIADAVDHYVEVAENHPSVIASVDGDDIGIITVMRHSEYAAEIYVMGVVPTFHRRGLGRAMLDHVEAGLAQRGVEFLQVKTLSSAHPDPGYALTRAFYVACGFRPLEEFPTLWDPSNPALQLVKSIRSP